jgi:hypothetical protein
MSKVSHAVPRKKTESPQRSITLNRILLGTAVSVFLTALPVIAQTEALDKVETSNSLVPAPGPIIPVDQLADVQPTDWAYKALRSFVEKYSNPKSFMRSSHR